jgi:hypothetical protein
MWLIKTRFLAGNDVIEIVIQSEINDFSELYDLPLSVYTIVLASKNMF